MKEIITKLKEVTTGQLKTRRHRLAQNLEHSEAVLRGLLVSQGRRCGKTTCKCQQGKLHGPYTYLTLGRESGASRLVYIPTSLVDVVKHHVEKAAAIDAVLAEISAINVELLKRRELD